MNYRDNKSRKIMFNIFVFLGYFAYDILITFVFLILNINTDKAKGVYLIITSIIYLLFLIYLYRKELIDDLGKFKLINVVKYIPIYIIGILLMAYSNSLLSNITNIDISKNEELVRQYIKTLPIYMSFSTVVYAPIVEEITFRKIFKNIFNNKYLFIILSGCIFGLVHMSLISTTFNDFLMIIPYIVMGIDFSYIYYKSDNIFTTITLHSIHNLILLIIQFIGG